MAEDGQNPNQLNQPEEAIPELHKESEANLNTDSQSRGVLEELDEVGGLQVEDMPESNELQERRRKTKNRLQELSNIKDENTEADGDAFENDEESGLMDLLREANLSPRHLKFCCGGILVIVLLVALFFGAKAGLNWWQNRPDEPDEVLEEGDDDEEVETQDPDEDENDYNFTDPTLLGGILVGEASSEADPATDAGEHLGDNSDGSDTLSQEIKDFSQIFETLQVDVNELLNKSSDRKSALDDYINQLNYLDYLAEQNLEQLTEESESLAEKFTAIEAQKEEDELRFFNELQDLDAPAANSALEAFVDEGQDIVRLRAEFNARQKLIAYFEQAQEVLQRRALDIDLNREALLKGVRVVEVEGSDLDLIIQAEDL